MQKVKTKQNNILLKTLCMIFLMIMVLYYTGFTLWAFDSIPAYDSLFRDIYTTVNPFTTGAYLVGILLLLISISFESIALKVLIALAYIVVIAFSLVAIMGMEGMSDLLIYVPHLFFLGISILITVRKARSRNNGEPSSK